MGHYWKEMNRKGTLTGESDWSRDDNRYFPLVRPSRRFHSEVRSLCTLIPNVVAIFQLMAPSRKIGEARVPPRKSMPRSRNPSPPFDLRGGRKKQRPGNLVAKPLPLPPESFTRHCFLGTWKKTGINTSFWTKTINKIKHVDSPINGPFSRFVREPTGYNVAHLLVVAFSRSWLGGVGSCWSRTSNPS